MTPSTPRERGHALAQAMDYRGDVTIHTDEGEIIEGYVFDRRTDVPEPYVRVIPKDNRPRVRIAEGRIARVVFSGRDTAAGKSWETWVRTYGQKKARGERAVMEPEPLDPSE